MCNTQGKQIMRQIVVAQHKMKVDITFYICVVLKPEEQCIDIYAYVKKFGIFFLYTYN